MAVKHVGLNVEAVKTRSVLSTTSESKTIEGSEVSVLCSQKLAGRSYSPTATVNPKRRGRKQRFGENPGLRLLSSFILGKLSYNSPFASQLDWHIPFSTEAKRNVTRRKGNTGNSLTKWKDP